DVLSAQFSSDGKMIVSSSSDKTINLWNVESGEILKQFKGHSDRVMRAKFSPNDKFIISCSLDDTIRIWDIKTGIEWKILKEHSHHVNDITYLPDGQTIVSCSSDNTIRLWNVESRKRIQILEGHSQALRCVDYKKNTLLFLKYFFQKNKKINSLLNLVLVIQKFCSNSLLQCRTPFLLLFRFFQKLRTTDYHCNYSSAMLRNQVQWFLIQTLTCKEFLIHTTVA
ncbi:WD repeat-containing protein, partial [Reticulomyxa filosa]